MLFRSKEANALQQAIHAQHKHSVSVRQQHEKMMCLNAKHHQKTYHIRHYAESLWDRCNAKAHDQEQGFDLL